MARRLSASNTHRRYVALGQQGGKQKTLLAKVLGGSQKASGNSSSSLAVFYVEQVALNRHVSPQPRLLPLCLKNKEMSRIDGPFKLPDNNLALRRVKYYVARTWTF